MKKFINIIAFVLAFLIIGFMLVPVKTVNKDSKVYVEHEWDTLDTVVLGSQKMLTVPSVHKSILGYGYIIKNEAQMTVFNQKFESKMNGVDKEIEDDTARHNKIKEKTIKYGHSKIHR